MVWLVHKYILNYSVIFPGLFKPHGFPILFCLKGSAANHAAGCTIKALRVCLLTWCIDAVLGLTNTVVSASFAMAV
jgi:hypothetical protein